MNTNSNYLPFSIRLIHALKQQGFISSGIMLPLLVGAYAIKDNRSMPIDYSYLKEVFMNLISELYEADTCLYLKECEASHNFVLEIGERPLRHYRLHLHHKGKPVIYSKDAETASILDNPTEVVQYLIDKYIAVSGKYCNFISDTEYPHMREIDMTKYSNHISSRQLSEFNVIVNLLNNA